MAEAARCEIAELEPDADVCQAPAVWSLSDNRRTARPGLARWQVCEQHVVRALRFVVPDDTTLTVVLRVETDGGRDG